MIALVALACSQEKATLSYCALTRDTTTTSNYSQAWAVTRGASVPTDEPRFFPPSQGRSAWL